MSRSVLDFSYKTARWICLGWFSKLLNDAEYEDRLHSPHLCVSALNSFPELPLAGRFS